jgi:predicted nuclease of predicted toxin-antitoxin system
MPPGWPLTTSMSFAPREAGELSALRFIADINISPQTVAALQKQGWQIARSSQWLPTTATDDEILEFARREVCVVITQDLDFSALLALSGHERPSLITLRLSTSEPEVVTIRLLEAASLLEKALAESCAITIEDSVVRIRKLPI